MVYIFKIWGEGKIYLEYGKNIFLKPSTYLEYSKIIWHLEYRGGKKKKDWI